MFGSKVCLFFRHSERSLKYFTCLWPIRSRYETPEQVSQSHTESREVMKCWRQNFWLKIILSLVWIFKLKHWSICSFTGLIVITILNSVIAHTCQHLQTFTFCNELQISVFFTVLIPRLGRVQAAEMSSSAAQMRSVELINSNKVGWKMEDLMLFIVKWILNWVFEKKCKT